MIDELPNGWARAMLSQISLINPRHPKGLDDALQVSFAPMAALSEDNPSFQFLEERPLGTVRKGFTHFAEGDVLFAKITPCMENGKGAVATSLRNGLGCGTTELHVIRPLDGINSNYLYRFLAQPKVRQEAKDNFTGSAGQARVPSSFIEELEIPLAPAKEQKRIVAKLEAVLAKVDGCQVRLAKIPTILKRFRQSVLAAACTGRLTIDWRKEKNSEDGDLPSSWTKYLLGDLCDLITKGASPKWQGVNYAREGILFVTSENVGSGKMLLDVKKYVEPHINTIQPRSILRKGDLLTNIVGASIGRSAMFDSDESANINQAVALIRLKENIERRYVLYVLNSPLLIDHMHSEKVDVARANLSLKDVAAFPIPLPSISEQREIVRRVEELLAVADRIDARFEIACAHVEKLTPSLLAKAFRGDLVPTEADRAGADGRAFESAAQLLARIKSLSKPVSGNGAGPLRIKGSRARLGP